MALRGWCRSCRVLVQAELGELLPRLAHRARLDRAIISAADRSLSTTLRQVALRLVRRSSASACWRSRRTQGRRDVEIVKKGEWWLRLLRVVRRGCGYNVRSRPGEGASAAAKVSKRATSATASRTTSTEKLPSGARRASGAPGAPRAGCLQRARPGTRAPRARRSASAGSALRKPRGQRATRDGLHLDDHTGLVESEEPRRLRQPPPSGRGMVEGAALRARLLAPSHDRVGRLRARFAARRANSTILRPPNNKGSRRHARARSSRTAPRLVDLALGEALLARGDSHGIGGSSAARAHRRGWRKRAGGS